MSHQLVVNQLTGEAVLNGSLTLSPSEAMCLLNNYDWTQSSVSVGGLGTDSYFMVDYVTIVIP